MNDLFKAKDIELDSSVLVPVDLNHRADVNAINNIPKINVITKKNDIPIANSIPPGFVLDSVLVIGNKANKKNDA
jgi:hypothetical protein